MSPWVLPDYDQFHHKSPGSLHCICPALQRGWFMALTFSTQPLSRVLASELCPFLGGSNSFVPAALPAMLAMEFNWTQEEWGFLLTQGNARGCHQKLLKLGRVLEETSLKGYTLPGISWKHCSPHGSQNIPPVPVRGEPEISQFCFMS